MALPIVGMCDVVSPPTMRAISLPLLPELLFELLDSHPGLLGTHVLNGQPEDAGELGEVVDVAAGRDQVEDITVADRRFLAVVQAVARHVRLLVKPEGLAVLGA